MSTEIAKVLTSRAEEKFGKERAGQLRLDIQQVAEDLEQVRQASLEIDDEPRNAHANGSESGHPRWAFIANRLRPSFAGANRPGRATSSGVGDSRSRGGLGRSPAMRRGGAQKTVPGPASRRSYRCQRPLLYERAPHDCGFGGFPRFCAVRGCAYSPTREGCRGDRKSVV